MQFAVRHLRDVTVCAIAIALACASTASTSAADFDPVVAWRRSLDAQRLPMLRADSTLTTTTVTGDTVTLEIRLLAKLQDDGVNRMVRTRIVSGATLLGSSFLSIEHPGRRDDLWIYLPAVQSPRRLVASNLGDSYFGSDFRLGDLVQPDPDDYIVTAAGERTIEGTPCFGIDITPKDTRLARDTGIGRQVLWLHKDNLMERRVEQHDRRGEPFKVIEVSGWREIAPGKWFAGERLIRNLQAGTSSRVVFEGVVVPKDVPNDLFAPQHLAEGF